VLTFENVYQGKKNNHHTPINPDDYIRLRLFSMIEFYRARLPKYSAFNERCQFLIMAGAVASATIAYLGYQRQVAIVSATTAGIAAWLEWTNLRYARDDVRRVALHDTSNRRPILRMP